MKLEIKDLTVDINNTGILEGISLGLEEKEFLVLKTGFFCLFDFHIYFNFLVRYFAR